MTKKTPAFIFFIPLLFHHPHNCADLKKIPGHCPAFYVEVASFPFFVPLGGVQTGTSRAMFQQAFRCFLQSALPSPSCSAPSEKKTSPKFPLTAWPGARTPRAGLLTIGFPCKFIGGRNHGCFFLHYLSTCPFSCSLSLRRV